jgi:hypothetical protein
MTKFGQSIWNILISNIQYQKNINMNQKFNICLFLLCHAFLAQAQHLEFGFQLNRLKFINPKPIVTTPPLNGQLEYDNTVQSKAIGLDYVPSVGVGYAYSLKKIGTQSVDIQGNVLFGIKGSVQYFQAPAQIFYRKGNKCLNKNSDSRGGFGIGLGASYQRFIYSNKGFHSQSKIIPQASVEVSLQKTILRFSTFLMPVKTIIFQTPYHYMNVAIFRSL